MCLKQLADLKSAVGHPGLRSSEKGVPESYHTRACQGACCKRNEKSRGTEN